MTRTIGEPKISPSFALAIAEDSESANAILDAVMPSPIAWEKGCYDEGDCTYTYGPPSWTNEPDTYEIARADLADIIDGGAVPAASSSTTFKTQGNITFSGRVDLR